MRTKLLNLALSEEQQSQMTIDNTVASDKKFIKRTKRDIEDWIEDLTEKLTVRLSATEPVDKSTIEVIYGGLLDAKAKLELYTKFESEFLS